MPEEEAFCLLVRLMNQYRLREMFIQDMPGLHLHLYQFERLFEDVEPVLCYHLHKRGVVPSLYATQWFLTLFAYRFPLQLVLRVYDLILSEGLEGAIVKFGIALMQKNKEALLSLQDMSALKTFLNERLFDAYIDSAPSANSILESGFFGNSGGSDKEVYRADLLVQDACAVKITPDVLKEYTVDYETRLRLEREREAEFENLRAANASLALKIRALEERAEKSDTDHVQIVSEMIQSKVHSEEIKMANEELVVEVAELKKIVASQPGEVEARLKEEMERIMSRNIEVQNENRGLEEQMVDMERDLVETKMRFAEARARLVLCFGCFTDILSADQCRLRNFEAEMVRPTTRTWRLGARSATSTVHHCKSITFLFNIALQHFSDMCLETKLRALRIGTDILAMA